MLDAKIKFFDIKKCGFYKNRNSNPEFGGLSDTLEKLASWAGDGREFVNTTTYEPDEDIDLRNTYFCNWKRNDLNGDSVLILWNEVQNDNGVIYGMEPLAKPGETSMLTTGFGNTPAIPGFPSYFWFIPEKQALASIKFEHSASGKNNLEYYINGFLRNKSIYRVMDSEEVVIGYSQDGKETEYSHEINPRFLATGRIDKEVEAELISNIHIITKIIKKETLKYTIEEDRKTVETFFSKLLNNAPVLNQTRTIWHELQFRPSVEQIKEIVRNFSNREKNSTVKNVGFIYSNGKRIMLDGSRISFSTKINVTRNDNAIITPESLLAAITYQRSDFLRVFEEVDLISPKLAAS